MYKELNSKRSKSAHERILRNGQKRARVGQKNQAKIFLAIFLKRLIRPLGKLVQTQKNRLQKSFFPRSYKSSKFGQISLLTKWPKNWAHFLDPPGHVFGRFSKSSHGRILISWNPILQGVPKNVLFEQNHNQNWVHENEKNYHSTFFSLGVCSTPMCDMSFTTIQYVDVRYLTSWSNGIWQRFALEGDLVKDVLVLVLPLVAHNSRRGASTASGKDFVKDGRTRSRAWATPD